MSPADWIVGLLLLCGLFFVAAGVVGILRMPDFYSRLHAQGKCDTLGVTLMLGAPTAHSQRPSSPRTQCAEEPPWARPLAL